MAEVGSRLAARGFRPAGGRRNGYVLNINDETLGGLNFDFVAFGSRIGATLVDPLVYVVNVPVSEIIRKAFGERRNARPRGTLGERLANLAPHRGLWEVQVKDAATMDDDLSKLIDAIDEHAIPWMRAHATLAEFAELGQVG